MSDKSGTPTRLDTLSGHARDQVSVALWITELVQMANTSQASDLEGLYREMHGIAEQIRIMNENNALLIQHLTTNNPHLLL